MHPHWALRNACVPLLAVQSLLAHAVIADVGGAAAWLPWRGAFGGRHAELTQTQLMGSVACQTVHQLHQLAAAAAAAAQAVAAQ